MPQKSFHYKNFAIILLIILIFSGISCRKNFDTVHGNADFSIEKDTLFLDSVFTGIASHTYHFKIYNNANKDITLNKIYLEHGEQSFYRLNVDGDTGKSFDNVLIHARDSIFVFVEVTADINQLNNPVYEENLFVEDDGKTDKILLTSFIKDAYFYYPERYPDGSKETLTLYTDPNTGETSEVYGFFLDGNTTFNADKPIVIYGHLAVPSGKTLNIEEGTHLYFHYNSGIIVWEDATLTVNGSLGNEVIFEDDRMEPAFDDKKGMWNFIWLRENSKNNYINYAIIKNAEVGIVAYPTNNNQPVLRIKNTRIFNHSLAGIYGIATSIEGENLVMNNFGLSALNLQLGGDYNFKHCTFANYSGGIRNEKSGAVYVSNYIKTQDEILIYDLNNFTMSNCIAYGNSSIEFYLDKNENAGFNYQIINSAIKFDDPQHHFSNIPEVDFNDTSHYQNILINEDPVFENPQENKMAIGDTSPYINQGDVNTAQQVPLDISGVNRTSAPDLGAYQHISFSNR
jgi:hypothetical protein